MSLLDTFKEKAKANKKKIACNFQNRQKLERVVDGQYEIHVYIKL